MCPGLSSRQPTTTMKKMLEFLEDGTGALSATRLGFLLWVLGVLGVWAVDSVLTQKVQGIDNSIITIIGILMSGKVVQSFSENIGLPNQAPRQAGVAQKKEATAVTAQAADLQPAPGV
jgi:hypothetical protein